MSGRSFVWLMASFTVRCPEEHPVLCMWSSTCTVPCVPSCPLSCPVRCPRLTCRPSACPVSCCTHPRTCRLATLSDLPGNPIRCSIFLSTAAEPSDQRRPAADALSWSVSSQLSGRAVRLPVAAVGPRSRDRRAGQVVSPRPAGPAGRQPADSRRRRTIRGADTGRRVGGRTAPFAV